MNSFIATSVLLLLTITLVNCAPARTERPQDEKDGKLRDSTVTPHDHVAASNGNQAPGGNSEHPQQPPHPHQPPQQPPQQPHQQPHQQPPQQPPHPQLDNPQPHHHPHDFTGTTRHHEFTGTEHHNVKVLPRDAKDAKDALGKHQEDGRQEHHPHDFTGTTRHHEFTGTEHHDVARKWPSQFNGEKKSKFDRRGHDDKNYHYEHHTTTGPNLV